MHASFVRSYLAVAGLAVGLGASLAAEEPAPPLPSEDLSGPPVVTARAWVVAEGANGGFLAAEEAETPLKAASTTKMMTCLVVLEQIDRDPAAAEEWVEFSEFAAATRGSRAELATGECIRVRDGLHALMLPSGNDMANAFAEHFEAPVRTAEGTEETRSWENTNQLLSRAEEYDGVKTGTAGGAGSCLVATGVREGRRLYVVVLGSAGNEARYADARNLFRWAWSQPPGAE